MSLGKQQANGGALSGNLNSKLLEVKSLSVAFRSDDDRYVEVIEDVSFEVGKGECIGLVGESGCGKSVTSMSIMQLLPQPLSRMTTGEIFFNGKDLTKMSVPELRAFRGHDIAMIFQEPMTALNPVYTVSSQMLECFRKDVPRPEAKARSIKLLHSVGLSEPELLMNNYPHELSGGMRQRVMIAMAIANNPQLLIADEPTTALDVTIQAQIMRLLQEVQQSLGMAMLLITHDLGVVFEMCDYVHVMYAGKIVESCSVQQLYESPSHPYTVGLLNSLPEISAEHARNERLPVIEGTVPAIGKFPRGCRFHNRCQYKTDRCSLSPPPLKVAPDGKHRFACYHPLNKKRVDYRVEYSNYKECL